MHKTEATYNDSGLYVDGPPGTRVNADSMNAIQKEIVTVIEGGGLTLLTAATESGVQLLAALNTLYVTPSGILGKNALINGDFRISQRGASGSAAYTGATVPLNSDDTYLHDRWILLSDGNDIVDFSQSTEAPTGGLLSCALDVETVNKKFGILQVIEQKNCAHMIGGNVSLSFQAKVSDITKLDNIKAMVVSWDGAADTVTSDIISAWNAEDTTPTLVANWTAENTPADLGVTATWAKYTIPNIAIDTASAKNIGVFIWSDGFCDTAATFLYITQVQLEKNTVASIYDWRNITDELTLCQRYYCKSYDQTVAPAAATSAGAAKLQADGLASADHNCGLHVSFPVDMRSTPSSSAYDVAGTIDKVTMAAGNGIVAVLAGISRRSLVYGGQNGAVNTNRFLQYQYTAESEL